jgi:hypothetical protein
MRRHLRSGIRALIDHHQPGSTARQAPVGGPVIMTDGQLDGVREAATSAVSPYETVP